MIKFPGLKKLDYAVILVSITGIILSFIFFYRPSNSHVLAWYVDGKRNVRTLDDADFEIKSSKGFVKVRIRDKKVELLDSSCSDKWCIRAGVIDKTGQSIVCLPSRIFIVIEDDKRRGGDEIDTVTK